MRVSPRTTRALIRAAATVMNTLTRVDPNKVVFLSRQSNTVPLDFELLIEEVKRRNPDANVVVICRRLDSGWQAKLSFALSQIVGMYHVAGAKVCVLDSYSPIVSVADHKDSLTVFQVWHAMGKIKKSGWQTVGLPQGRNRKVAETLRMHHGYDYIVAGAEEWNDAYVESFNASESQLLNVGLPRADHLLNQRDAIRKRILTEYPELGTKPIVLYAPTFRRGGGVGGRALRLAKTLDLDRYNLVVKGHANQPLLAEREGVFDCAEFTGMELLAVADYLITDYSAIAVEAALLNVKTFYYLYDYDEYEETNGLNLDVAIEFPELTFMTARDVVKALDSHYPIEALGRYQGKYLFDEPGQSTQRIVNAIFEKGRLCQK